MARSGSSPTLAGLAAAGIAALVGASPALAFDETMVAAVAKARRSVVSVLPDWPADVRRVEEPEGSGVVVADGRMVLTAAHVVGRAKTLRIRLDNGDVVAAEIAFRDVETDVAILSVATPLPAFDLTGAGQGAGAAAPFDPAPGEPVCAIGNAFGLGLSVSCGVVSAIHRAGVGFNDIEDFVQSDTSVNPGASGGALVDGEGRLVGMLSAIFTKGTDADIGVNFAVSEPLLQRLVAQYRERGRIDHLRLGVELKRAPEPGGTGPAGLRVLKVVPGSAAAGVGLAEGDLIVSLDGVPVAAVEGLRGQLARARGAATLGVLRAGKPLQFIVETTYKSE